jgi:hypothetical protein
MRHIAAFILSAGLAAMASSLWACQNDRYAPRFEREFQDQYEPAEPNTPNGSPFILAGMGVGGAMLAGSLVYSLIRPTA